MSTERKIKPFIDELALDRQKMVLLSGARQSGKTTLAKTFLRSQSTYFNWDSNEFKKKWTRGADQIGKDLLEQKNPTIVLDEFHKNMKWKNQIKGFYDQFGDQVKIIITGSAKLNQFKKGADSLLGRFLHFHVHPFTLGELNKGDVLSFKDFLTFLEKPEADESKKSLVSITDNLFKFSGFPEPFLAGREQIYSLWHKNRVELLIRQDLKDLSQIINIGQLEILAEFMPERVGSPLSVQSLREDLDVAHTTISRWLNALSNVYYHFEIKPFSYNIVRSLKKEGKIYLYDYAQITDEGAKFENMVAMHLLKLVDHFNDTGQADLSLNYLRNKNKEEVDFVILSKKQPIATIEVKLNDKHLDQTFVKFQKKFKAPHFQIIKTPDVFRQLELPSHKATVISFENFFRYMP